jgi:hypothetical protein
MDGFTTAFGSLIAIFFQEKGYTLYGLKPDPTSGHYKPVHEPVACESFPTVSLQI